MESSKIEPEQVSYVEIHGTGTALGDPIEVGALSAVLGKKTDGAATLFTLSAKTPTALKHLAERYQDYLATTLAAIGDICFTANVGRSHFNYRLGVITSSTTQLQGTIGSFC